MVDLSLDESMDSYSHYLESWNVGTKHNGQMRPYFDEEVPFHSLWLLTDEFTKFRVAPECTSCVMTGVHTKRASSWMQYCNCYKPLQSPSIFTVDVSELPMVTLSRLSPDELYVDPLIKLKPGRKKQKQQRPLRQLDVVHKAGPAEVHLDNDRESMPRIRIEDVFKTNWIAATFWSIMVILCVLIAAFGYTKCERTHTSTPSEAESSSSVLPGSAYWIRI